MSSSYFYYKQSKIDNCKVNLSDVKMEESYDHVGLKTTKSFKVFPIMAISHESDGKIPNSL